MPAPILRRTPLFLGDHWPRLSVSDAQADPWATAPGSAGVTAASGLTVHVQPYQAGHDLTSRTPPCRRTRGLSHGHGQLTFTA